MGLSGARNVDSEMTPYRRTHVIFDVDEPVAVEPPFAITRKADEMGRAIADGATPSSNVELYSRQFWSLSQIQDNLYEIHEQGDPHSAVIPFLQWQLAPNYEAVNLQRKNSDLTLTSVTYDPSVTATGDQFIKKSTVANAAWDQHLAGDALAFPPPTSPSASLPPQRVGMTPAPFPEDTGFLLRFTLPGTLQHAPDVVKRFYFGGPASPDNSGTFCLDFGGDGQCHLYERGNASWLHRVDFLYAHPGDVAGASHSMRIMPHTSPFGGGYIDFSCDTTKIPPSNLVSAYHAAPTGSRLFTYTVRFTKPKPPAPAPPTRRSVTGAGPIRRDERPDQMILIQVSRLLYEATGILTEAIFELPFYASVRTNLILSWTAVTPAGTVLDGKLFDADTNAELTLVSTGTNQKTYKLNHKQFHYYAQFAFASSTDRTLAPRLYQYTVQKDGVIANTGVTPFEGGVHSSYNISGPESDMSHETATVETEDLKNLLPTLRARAMIRSRIETEYDALDSTKRAILFDGYLSRADARKRGTAGRLYPSPEWRDLQGTFVGVWARLNETLSFVRFPYFPDPNAPDVALGSGLVKPGFKITDLVRRELSWAGFADDQIDVPDSPIRYFPPQGSNDEAFIEPLRNVGELAANLLKNYLGWYLTWDANAGTRGMIRARPPAIAPYTNNLIAFTTAGPATGKLPHKSQSYNTGNSTWVGNGTGAVNVPIQTGTFRTYVKPPEANLVLVYGVGGELPDSAGQYKIVQWAANPKSYNFFTDAAGVPIVTADPTHPDYLGRIVPLVILDPAVGGGQGGVNWITRRYYDITCHAIKMAAFDSVLPLVTDPADAFSTKPRAPRYYDECTVNGDQFLVRNCNPTYHRDGFQMASWELEAPRI